MADGWYVFNGARQLGPFSLGELKRLLEVEGWPSVRVWRQGLKGWVAPSDLPESVALATGRPALVVPHIGAKPPGKVVLLCWNASREAARAASDAMPLLTAADQVIVLAINPTTSAKGHGAEPGTDAAAWLARHGVKVTVQRDVAMDADVGGVILSRAADHDVDLIVMGIYGHSRIREMVLGGASRTLLGSMTVPVFMSH
jgi:nucleotide-binding universal stress UspA family protein